MELNVDRRISPATALVAALAIVAACAGGPQAPAKPTPSVAATLTPSPTAAPTPVVVEGKFDVGGFDLWIHCEGTGSPTVLLESGLGERQLRLAERVFGHGQPNSNLQVRSSGLG